MLLIDPNDQRRESLARALSASGVEVRAVARIADVERWPSGETVITDAAIFTRLWLDVGAAWVVVFAQGPQEGASACARGATTWVPHTCDARTLQQVLRALDEAAFPHDSTARTLARAMTGLRQSPE